MAGTLIAARAQPAPPAIADSLTDLQRNLTTSSYKEAAITLLLEDANRLAKKVGLHEPIPIARSNLVSLDIASPYWSQHARVFGSISTENYHYFASVGNKLSFVERYFGANGERESEYLATVKERYTLPKSQVDTNRAYAIATQWLAAAEIDVEQLERGGRVAIRFWDMGNKFVPIYWIAWSQPFATTTRQQEVETLQNVASVQLLEPEQRLLKLRVEKPQYIKRRPLVVRQAEALLQQTEDPMAKQVLFTTPAYKEAATRCLLTEAGLIARELHLDGTTSIERANLDEIVIETPFVSDRSGAFGWISTPNYIFGAYVSNKLSYVSINFRVLDEEKYLAALKAHYRRPKSQVNFESAEKMATQWLAAAHVDIKRLQSECKLSIRTWDWDSGSDFVPLYLLTWHTGDHNWVATVELVEPEHLLKKLSIGKSQYIQRESLSVAERQRLLGHP